MTNRAEEAWKYKRNKAYRKYCESDRLKSVGDAFDSGYEAGQSDAWQLPEVRADELETCKFYIAVANGPNGETVCGVFDGDDGFSFVGSAGVSRILDLESFTSFRGPLPLGGGE